VKVVSVCGFGVSGFRECKHQELTSQIVLAEFIGFIDFLALMKSQKLSIPSVVKEFGAGFSKRAIWSSKVAN